MKIHTSSCVLKFTAIELAAATNDFIADVAGDALVDASCLEMVDEAFAFLRAVLIRDSAYVVGSFSSGQALPSFCGVDSGTLSTLGDAVVSVEIAYPCGFVLVVPTESVSW